MVTRTAHTTVYLPLQQMPAKPPEDWFDYAAGQLSDYVLSGRITANWQECLMIAGTAAAMIGIAFTFFAGVPFLCGCFTLLLGTSVTGIYFARKYATLSNLQNTVEDLRQTQERFEVIANDLERENTRLEATNQNLETRVQEFQAANQVFEANNQRLEATNQNLETRVLEFDAANQVFAANNQRLTETNQRLEETNQNLEARAQEFEAANQVFAANNQNLQVQNQHLEETAERLEETNQNLEGHNVQLRQGVTDLTLQVTQLTTSAETIRAEMIEFKRANDALGNHVEGFDASLDLLDQQIDTSKEICTQIEQHLTVHQRELGEQLGELRQLITDLRTDGSTNEKLIQLNTLYDRIDTSTERLHQIENQYAAERGRLEGIVDVFARIQQELDETNLNLQRNVAGFVQQREAFGEQTERIQNLINQVLAPPPQAPFPPLPLLQAGIAVV